MQVQVEVRELPIGELVPADYNPRKDLQPEDEDYQTLQRVLEEFGLVEPLIWNETTGHLVGGHQRLKVLRAAGAKTIPVSVVRLELKDEQALNVALNKVGGDWEPAKLTELLSSLSNEGMLELTGFDEGELDRLIEQLASAGAEGDDDKEEDPLGYIIAYQIVFDNEGQQQQWFNFLRHLSNQYPDKETIAERLAEFLTVQGIGG